MHDYFDESFLQEVGFSGSMNESAQEKLSDSSSTEGGFWPTQEFAVPNLRADHQSHNLLYNDANQLFGDIQSYVRGDKNYSVPEASQGDTLAFFMKQAAQAMTYGIEKNGELLEQLREKGFDAAKLNSIAHQKQVYDSKVFGTESRLYSLKAVTDGNTLMKEARFGQAIKEILETQSLSSPHQAIEMEKEDIVSKVFGKLGSLFNK